jgi:tetratricopeptide (TPR) repeat protein
LEAEHDNLRTALDWSQVQTESREPMLRLAGALNGYWEHRGDLSEGRFWLENALRDADGSEAINIRARAFFGAGRLANDQGDKAGARPLLERSAGLWRACGDSGKNGLAYALCYLGGVVRELGDVPQAHSLLTESVALFKAQDDPWGLAFALVYLGMVLRDETDYTGARLLMEESHALWREIGEPWGIALVLHHLGLVALRQGDYEGAQNWCEESLLLRKRLGNKQDIAYSLHTVGVVVLNQGRILPAKPYMQYSQTLFGELGDKYGLASTLSYLGYIELFDGDEIRAQYLFEKSLALAREGGPKWLIALPLARLAGLAALRGRVVQAIMLWEAVEAHMDACNSYLDNGDRIYYERLIAPACAALSEQTVAAARADGRKMTLEETIQLALKATQLE